MFISASTYKPKPSLCGSALSLQVFHHRVYWVLLYWDIPLTRDLLVQRIYSVGTTQEQILKLQKYTLTLCDSITVFTSLSTTRGIFCSFTNMNIRIVQCHVYFDSALKVHQSNSNKTEIWSTGSSDIHLNPRFKINFLCFKLISFKSNFPRNYIIFCQ